MKKYQVSTSWISLGQYYPRRIRTNIVFHASMSFGPNHVDLPPVKPKLVPKRLAVAIAAFWEQSPGNGGSERKDFKLKWLIIFFLQVSFFNWAWQIVFTRAGGVVGFNSKKVTSIRNAIGNWNKGQKSQKQKNQRAKEVWMIAIHLEPLMIPWTHHPSVSNNLYTPIHLPRCLKYGPQLINAATEKGPALMQIRCWYSVPTLVSTFIPGIYGVVTRTASIWCIFESQYSRRDSHCIISGKVLANHIDNRMNFWSGGLHTLDILSSLMLISTSSWWSRQ